MELLSITDLQDREFSTMSTGEQRKFLLARSLVNDPAVLVFDEPTSGLDMSTCFQYLEIIGATFFGFWLFGDFPTITAWLGITIIVLSGIYVFKRETMIKT